MIRHFLSVEDLNYCDIEKLIIRGRYFLDRKEFLDILKNKFFFNVFFEDSTRTLSSFSVAATKLGASVVNINMQSSSKNKGESEIDTIKNLCAVGANFIAIRHSGNMSPHIYSRHLSDEFPSVKILNGGDGVNEHPTQALGDLLTILKNFNCEIEALKNLKIVIFGDIKNNRVAHSHIKLYKILGIKNVHLVAPPEFLCDYRGSYDDLFYHHSLTDGIKDADLIIALRFKKEYENSNSISSGVIDEFKSFYSLNHDNIKFAKKDVKIMHPGPMNRGIELSSKLADDKKYSLILDQVSCGVAMRQAIIEKLHLDDIKYE
jgi:aspartate carbamoyltransferase catalytic subunit